VLEVIRDFDLTANAADAAPASRDVEQPDAITEPDAAGPSQTEPEDRELDATYKRRRPFSFFSS